MTITIRRVGARFRADISLYDKRGGYHRERKFVPGATAVEARRIAQGREAYLYENGDLPPEKAAPTLRAFGERWIHEYAEANGQTVKSLEWTRSPARPTMKLNAYIDSLQRAARNLPGLLARWSSISVEMQDHYSDEIAWLLAEREDALAAARRQGRWSSVEVIITAELQLHALIALHPELGLNSSADAAELLFGAGTPGRLP